MEPGALTTYSFGCTCVHKDTPKAAPAQPHYPRGDMMPDQTITYRKVFRGSIDDLLRVLNQIPDRRIKDGLPIYIEDSSGTFSYYPVWDDRFKLITNICFCKNRKILLNEHSTYEEMLIDFKVFSLPQNETEVTIQCPAQLQKHADYIIEALKPWWDDAEVLAEPDQAGEMPAEPPRPGENGKTWDDVFKWYYSVPRAVCENFEDLAKLICLAPGTVRNRHSDYKAQHSDKMSSRK